MASFGKVLRSFGDIGKKFTIISIWETTDNKMVHVVKKFMDLLVWTTY